MWLGEYGEGGIWTHEPLLVTRFQVERDQPLCHLSKAAIPNILSLELLHKSKNFPQMQVKGLHIIEYRVKG